MRSFRHPRWQHLDYRVKVATTQENKPPTQGTRQWTFTTPRWRYGSILLPSLNAGVPEPTGGTKFEGFNLKKMASGMTKNVKISNWVSMHIFNELQGPLPASWIGRTRWIISVKSKLIRLVHGYTDREPYVIGWTDEMRLTKIQPTFVWRIKNVTHSWVQNHLRNWEQEQSETA